MLKRQTSGSVVCPSCGRLVGVNDERCFNCGKWNPGLWGYGPILNKLGRDLGFTEIILGGCTLFFLFTVVLAQQYGQPFSLSSLFFFGSEAYQIALLRLGSSGSVPVFELGRWWTILSAAWLHGGLLHIFMNMMALRQLAPAVGEFFGVSRLVIIYTFSAAAGFLVTSILGPYGIFPFPIFTGAAFTVGASAPLLGLCGALVLYGQRTGSRALTQQIVQWVLILLVIGLLMRFMDNWAHIGGFAGGYLIARWLDPLKDETPMHSVAALGCLVLHVGALLLSFFSVPNLG